MKIELKGNMKMEQIENIGIGECFVIENEYYMRTCKNAYDFDGLNRTHIRCVNLKSGDVDNFKPDIFVTPVDARVVIE